MAVNNIASPMMILSQRFVSMRNDLLSLQQQLGTGRSADSFGGLGAERDLALAFRSTRSAATAYRQTISTVDVRINVMQTALERLSALTGEAKSTLNGTAFELTGGSQTAEQKTARLQLEEMAALLNSHVDGRYLFSGQTIETEPVAPISEILDGDATHAGFRQVMAERREADLGANGLGRLAISAGPGDGVTLAEDVAGHPFGFKITGISTTSAAVATTGPTGAENTVTTEFTGLPTAGEQVRIYLDLPDGTSTTVTLNATHSTSPLVGQFTIGADTATTAANFQSALDAALSKTAATELAAASGIAAADNFFATDDANPPMRVDGPPFDSATALIAGTSANTVSWYKGEAGTTSARNTSTARVDDSTTIAYGARANEVGLRTTFQMVAVAAAATFSASDPNAAGEYEAMASRIRFNIDDVTGDHSPSSVSVEIAIAQRSMDVADTRHTTSQNYMSELIDDIEGVETEELAAKILTVQTRLEATYQVTSMLAQLSLTNYL
ncbi:MAG TPA: flagellar biosynthesis protein FlgL [Hyphomicrobiales bacterium]|nr:flagellar biosynthesis protein FlgL [Kaistiaceae bacterium]HQF29949.1 flagellar biosynthesis protein FlgL [Hyphomicrobiales bacterium]